MLKKMIFVTALCLQLFAHDIWTIPSGKDLSYEVVYGHGDKFEPYDVTKVKEVKGYSETGATSLATSIEKSRVKFVVPKQTVAVTVKLDNGFWCQTVDGWKNVRKKDTKERVLASAHTLKYHKNILSWNRSLSKPLGLPLEIVTLANPLKLKVGDTFDAIVYKDKKPLARAKVEMDENVEKQTDADGKIKLKIEKNGFNIFSISYKTIQKPADDVDYTLETAILTFITK